MMTKQEEPKTFKLKRCMRCKSRAVHLIAEDDWHMFGVECKRCGLRGASRPREHEAVQNWNDWTKE